MSFVNSVAATVVSTVGAVADAIIPPQERVFGNVYLMLEMARGDPAMYSLLMRTSKPFNQFINGNPGLRAEIRDSFLTVTVTGDRTEWRFKGELHRLDGPAVEYADGTKSWRQNDKRHRLDGPAVECADGRKYWCQNDRLHRLDGPAVVYADGSTVWYQNGRLIRKPKRQKV